MRYRLSHNLCWFRIGTIVFPPSDLSLYLLVQESVSSQNTHDTLRVFPRCLWVSGPGLVRPFIRPLPPSFPSEGLSYSNLTVELSSLPRLVCLPSRSVVLSLPSRQVFFVRYPRFRLGRLCGVNSYRFMD